MTDCYGELKSIRNIYFVILYSQKNQISCKTIGINKFSVRERKYFTIIFLSMALTSMLNI